MKRMCNFPAQFLFTIMLRYKFFVGAVLLFGASVTAFYPLTVKEHVLVRHNYFTLHAKDWLNCIMSCNEDQRCVSYNYEYSATSNGICELNECGVDPNKPVEEVLIYTRGFVFQQLRPNEDREQCTPKVCPVGYHGNGITCKDIDECTNGTHNCSQNANCTNTKGSFNCTCVKGYHGDGVTCKDIDECTNGTHNCSQNAKCANTDGSFNCSCLEGYIGGGVMCKAIDECIDGTHNCSLNANCSNTEGSFNCTCLEGYIGDGVTCKDIDECRDGTYNCSVNANCTNTKGSFNCTCVKGYHGDGVTCKVCKSGWQHFNGSCYNVSDDEKTWDDAKTKCESYGARLASIHSTEENSFLAWYIQVKLWIGLNDKKQEGHFTWIDGTPVDYTNWATGRPNNKNNNRHCVLLRKHPNYTWNNRPCSVKLFFVCRYYLW